MIEEAPFRDLPKGVIIPQSWMAWIGKIRMYAGSAEDKGTANPTENLWVGRRFYRTDLTIPVYCSAVSGVWRDAAGTIVP